MNGSPPGKRSGPVGTGPLDEIAFAGTPSIARTHDVVPLKHQLVAVYFRDPDKQAQAEYEAWLAEQRQGGAA
jgi:hypothetical protein